MPPDFPPDRTVHASFPAHGAPSLKSQRLVTIPQLPLQKHLRFDHCFSAAVRMLIVLRHPICIAYLLLFLVPMNLSVHTLLGACYEPAGWAEPVTQHGVSYSRFYSTAPAPALYNAASDPFIRKFVRWCVILTMSVL